MTQTELRVLRSPADLYIFDPLREVDWRYARILDMIGHSPRPLRCRASDDEWVREMREFLLLYRVRDERARERLFPQYPGPYFAFKMHESPDTRLQQYLQARLLARQTDAEIADKMSTLPEAVHWYERVFFNVRDRFDNIDWVVRSVINPARTASDPLDMPLKLFGYLGGPTMLEFMITGFKPIEQKPSTSEDIDKYLSDFITSNVRRRAAVAVQSFQVNKYNVMQLFDLMRQIRADDAAIDTPAEKESLLIKNVRAFLDGMEVTAGKSIGEPQLGQNSVIAYSEQHAAELRDFELYAASLGPADELKELADLKFPDAARITDENPQQGS